MSTQSGERTNRSIRARGRVREQERSNCYDPGKNRRVKDAKEGRDSSSPEEGEEEQANNATKREQRGGDGRRKEKHSLYPKQYVEIFIEKIRCQVTL